MLEGKITVYELSLDVLVLQVYAKSILSLLSQLFHWF